MDEIKEDLPLYNVTIVFFDDGEIKVYSNFKKACDKTGLVYNSIKHLKFPIPFKGGVMVKMKVL